MSPSRSEHHAGLPPLWAGARRRHLALLVAAGLGQATIAGLGAHVVLHLLRSGSAHDPWLLLAGLVACAVAVGALRMAERVVSEQLGQDYVHEIRVGLLRRNLVEGQVGNLGVAVARTTNDLTSVRNWVSQGVATMAVAAPLLAGTAVVLFLIDPLLALGLLAPLVALAVGMHRLVPATYERTRALRRARGRLAGQVADTVLATAAIRSAGGTTRELNRVERYSRTLVRSAVRRAVAAGGLRGVAAATSGLATATLVGTGLAAGLPGSHVAAALTLTGLLAAPIHDLGKAAEFRQTYRAARRIIGPAIEPPHVPHDADLVATATAPTPSVAADPPQMGVLVTAGLTAPDGVVMTDLVAGPGDRLQVRTGSPEGDTAVLEVFAGLRAASPGTVTVSGADLATASAGRRRRLVGFGARGMMLARTTVARAVAYRSAEPDGDQVARLLRQVGLDDRVAQLPSGLDTLLRHGGQPLTIPERARLTLARALYGHPAVLVFDHLDADLGYDGRAVMREVLRTYPGVVLVASDNARAIIGHARTWEPVGRRAAPAPASTPLPAVVGE